MIFSCPHCNVEVARNQRTCPTCNRTMLRTCTACAENVSVLSNQCKYCGENLRPEVDALRPVNVVNVPAPEVQFLSDTCYVKWEDKKAGGAFKRWWATWWKSVADPEAFWRKMPSEGCSLRPVSYAWFQVAQALIVALPLLIVSGEVHACDRMISVHGHEVTPLQFGLGYLAAFPATFIAMAAILYIGSALWHIPLMLLGAKGGYSGTLRIMSYNSGVSILSALPIVGTVVGGILSLFMNFHGYRSMHKMSKFRAGVAVALPVVLGLGGAAVYYYMQYKNGCIGAPTTGVSC